MGMGRLYAERAVAEGARSVILWDRDAAALTSTAAELTAGADVGTQVSPYVVDISDLGAIAQTAQRVRTEVGDPDIVINNAGIIRGKYFWEHGYFALMAGNATLMLVLYLIFRRIRWL